MDIEKSTTGILQQLVTKFKKNPSVYVIGLIAAVFAGIASFVGSIDKIVSFYDKYSGSKLEKSGNVLTMFVGSTDGKAINFSISNPSDSRSVDIAAIFAFPIATIDSCPVCDFRPSKPVSVDFKQSQNKTKLQALVIHTSPKES